MGNSISFRVWIWAGRQHTPERYRDRCSCTVLYFRVGDVLNDLAPVVGAGRRHDCDVLLGRAGVVIVDSCWHCREKWEVFSDLRERENVERRPRLGTNDFDIVTAL